MPDIDSLSLNITASSNQAVTAINNIITALGKLNSALSNYSAESKYVSGLNNLIGGFNGLSSSINSIDIQKIKSLNTVLTTLAKNGETLSKLNYVSSFTELGSEAQKVSSEIKAKVNEIAKAFHIPKEEIKTLTAHFRELYSATDNRSYDAAYGKIEELVKKYAKVEGATKAVKEEQKKFREELSKTQISIDKGTMQDWGDSSKSNRGVYGIRNTTTGEGGESIIEAAHEMDIYAESTREADEKLRELAKDSSKALAIQEATHGLSAAMEGLREKILGVVQAKKALDADEEFMTDDPSFDLFDTKVKETTASITKLDAAMDNMQAESREPIGNPFEGLIIGLEELNGYEIPAEKYEGVATLAKAFKDFGKGDAANAIEVIPQIGKAFAEMARELNNAPAISDNLVRLAESLSHFSKSSVTATTASANLAYSIGTALFRSLKVIPVTLNGIYAALQKDIASLKNFANRVWGLVTALGRLIQTNTRTRLSFTSLAAVFGTLYANFFLLIRAARLLGKAIDYSSSMTEAQNVVSVTFGKQADALDDFAKTAIKDFGLARLSAVQFASRFQAMGKTMGITSEQIVKANDFIAEKVKGNSRAYKDLGDSVADMSINLTKLTADMASLYNQDYDSVADDMAAIYTGMTRPLRKYGLDLTQATLKEWAMSQGLDSNIEKMTQAQKTLLRYQYVMAHTAGAMGDFAKTADTWANSIRTVKQYLQELARVIGEGLINTFKPALIAFRNFLENFISLAQSALNAVGKLLGWTKIDFGGASLVEDMEDYADAIDDATGAAKKLKGQLRGIDELNNLTTNQGGGGGGGVASALGLDGLEDWQELAESTEKYESVIDSWYELGKAISTKFTEGMLSIDWGKIYLDFMKFGNHLAELLNGLIQPGSFRIAGETVANGLNAIGLAFNRFLAKFNFQNAGVSIANFINGLFKNWNPDTWIENIRLALGGIIDAIDGFFNGMEGEFNHIDGLDIESIHEKIKTFITGTVEAIKTDLAKIDWKNVFEVFSTIGTNIADLLNSVITPENFKTVGETLARVLNAVFISLKDFGAKFDFKELGTSIAASINGLFEKWRPQDWAETLNTFVNGFFDVLNGLFMGDGEGGKGLDIAMIGTKIAYFFTQLDPKIIAAGIGGVIIKAVTTLAPIVFSALGTLFHALSPIFPKLFKIIWPHITNLWTTSIWPALQLLWTGTIYPEIEGALLGLASQGGLLSILGTIATKIIGGIFAAISGYFIGNGLGESIALIFGDYDAAEEYEDASLLSLLGIDMDLWEESWMETFDEFFGNIAEFWGEDVAGFFEGIGKDFSENAGPIFEEMGNEFDEFWTGVFDDIKLDKVILWFEDLPGTVSETFTNVKSTMTDWWNNEVKPKFSKETWEETVAPIKETITTVWQDTVDFWTGAVPEWWDEHVAPWFTKEKWDGIVQNIKDSITEIWNNTVSWWKENVQTWWDNNVAPWFTKDTWLGVLDGILQAFTSVWGDAESFAKGFFNNVAQFAEDFINGIIDGFKALAGAKSLFTDTPIAFNVEHVKLPRFANGGYPAVGSLFIAGEAGSEMVGNINGRTGVASHGEITGISDTIRSTASAEIELLREQNVLLQGILEKEFGISNDSLFKSVRTSAREYTRRTGNPAW